MNKQEVDKMKVEQVIDFLRAKASQNLADAPRLRAMSSSFARIYKETTDPAQDWKVIETNRDDLERRLRLFAIKMRPKFKSPDLTLPSYSSRARRALSLYLQAVRSERSADADNDNAKSSNVNASHSLFANPPQAPRSPAPYSPGLSSEISFTIEQLNRQIEIMRRYLEILSASVDQNKTKGSSME